MTPPHGGADASNIHVEVDKKAKCRGRGLLMHHFTSRNPALHNTLALTPAKESDVRVILLFCLVFSRLLKGLMDAAY